MVAFFSHVSSHDLGYRTGTQGFKSIFHELSTQCTRERSDIVENTHGIVCIGNLVGDSDACECPIPTSTDHLVQSVGRSGSEKVVGESLFRVCRDWPASDDLIYMLWCSSRV
ncbi:hypothetical protein Hamer_G009024 [Homarus americanus]|uniref:Uncharacterized protein n=1 Tax=Homarus americanus TaxID=6706 RepID=A0A8J5NB28_HOMAM|nr:hypothetical protein Hamer_G009024 [Homarus americanus]